MCTYEMHEKASYEINHSYSSRVPALDRPCHSFMRHAQFQAFWFPNPQNIKFRRVAVAQLAARRSHNPKIVSSILTCHIVADGRNRRPWIGRSRVSGDVIVQRAILAPAFFHRILFLRSRST